MRRLFIALLASYALIAPIRAVAATDPLMLPIHQFVDGFNRGDTATALAAFRTDGVAILDDVPPFTWSGPKAMATWVHDLTTAESKAGITGGKVTLGLPLQQVMEGPRAYVVVPSVYHFLKHGKPFDDTARFAFVLQKAKGTWLIAAWTWSGSAPQPGK